MANCSVCNSKGSTLSSSNDLHATQQAWFQKQHPERVSVVFIVCPVPLATQFLARKTTTSVPGANECNVLTAAKKTKPAHPIGSLNVWSVVSYSANCSGQTLFAVSAGHNFGVHQCLPVFAGPTVVLGFVFEPHKQFYNWPTSPRQVVKICTSGFEHGFSTRQSNICTRHERKRCVHGSLVSTCALPSHRARRHRLTGRRTGCGRGGGSARGRLCCMRGWRSGKQEDDREEKRSCRKAQGEPGRGAAGQGKRCGRTAGDGRTAAQARENGRQVQKGTRPSERDAGGGGGGHGRRAPPTAG